MLMVCFCFLDRIKMFKFQNVFMITRLKYFYDTLNTVVILAPGRELFSAKCTQFPLTFTERN